MDSKLLQAVDAKKTMPKTSKLLLSGRCHTKWLQGETELERFSFFVQKAALVNRRQNAVKSAPRSGAQGEKSPKGTFPLKPQLVTRRSQLWTISFQPIACTASKSRELTTFDLSVFCVLWCSHLKIRRVSYFEGNIYKIVQLLSTWAERYTLPFATSSWK